MQTIKCETNGHIISSISHITIDDDFLFHRIMYFCNWTCLRQFMTNNGFVIKKESIFAVDLA